MLLFSDEKVDSILLVSEGKAISKLVKIAEIIKMNVFGLHQIIELSSLEENVDTTQGALPKSRATLLLSKKELNTSHIGYQRNP